MGKRLELHLCPDSGWEYFNKTSYTPEDNDYHYIDKATLNSLLKAEIILDEMARHGVCNWEDYDSCMEAVQKRLKNGDDE